MKKVYIIRAGLGGSFDSCEDFKAVYFPEEEVSEEELMEVAREYAVDEYASYEGMHGVRDVDDIMEEDGIDYDEAIEIYQEEIESWIGYDYLEVTASNVKEMIEEYIEYLDDEALGKLDEVFGFIFTN